jgi:hypothetical protein
LIWAEVANYHGRSRQPAKVRILLGNLLWKRGHPEEAFEILQEAKRLAEQA